MSQTVEERGLDAFTDDDWQVVDEMADEYDDQLGDDLRALHEAYADGEGDDER